MKLFFEAIAYQWSRKLDWLTYQTANHHLEHMGLSSFGFLICVVCGATWEQSAYIVMALGLVAEVAGLLTGETLRNAICDICQYWLFSPLILMAYGNWILAWVWLAVLLFGYLYTLLSINE